MRRLSHKVSVEGGCCVCSAIAVSRHVLAARDVARDRPLHLPVSLLSDCVCPLTSVPPSDGRHEMARYVVAEGDSLLARPHY